MSRKKPPLTKHQSFAPRRIMRSQMKFMPGNPQDMNDEQVEALNSALNVNGGGVGLLQTVVWNKQTGHIVGGNHRVKEIDKLELYDPVTHANDYMIDVAEIDVGEERERAIVLALNNPRLSGQPRVEALRQFLGEIPDADRGATGFTADDCSYLLGPDKIEVKDREVSIGQLLWGPNVKVVKEVEEVIEDEPPELTDAPVIAHGELWTLGKHRLLCGDSEDAAAVARLLVGETPFMMVTDPPYGVNYDPRWRLETGLNKEHQTRAEGKVSNDDKATWQKAWELFPGTVAYVWHSALHGSTVAIDLMNAKFEVRAQIIWSKPSLVIGRGAYHWQHEPCSMPGTMVSIGSGRGGNERLPVEQLRDGDMVVSWSNAKVHRRGRPVRVKSRHYSGLRHVVRADGRETATTHNHHWSVRTKSEGFVTYLMKQRNRYRVGYVAVRDTAGFGLLRRMKKEGADCGWILAHYETAREARVWEQINSVKFGIPTTHWAEPHPTDVNENTRTLMDIDRIYREIGPLDEKAIRLLESYGRDIEYPIAIADEIRSSGSKAFFSRKKPTIVHSCNLVPGVFQVPVDTGEARASEPNGAGREGFAWADIESITRSPYDGLVYSLDVEEHQHYVADGLITHNCWYASRGTAKWTGDRKQSTIWNIQNMHRTQGNVDDGKTDHGTQKPVECMARPIRHHGDENDSIYDPFGGSGTTIIAAEQLGRRCFMMELDPAYCQMILERYWRFTGIDPVREDGTKLSDLIALSSDEPAEDDEAEDVTKELVVLNEDDSSE